ncbi:MAG: hypothetical protein AB8F95_15820 [Bacteroidia bacterium]
MPSLIQDILHLEFQALEEVNLDIQITLERKPDFLLKVFPVLPEQKPFLLHVEFQAKDDGRMVDRMLEYRAFARREVSLPVKQFVIYLGEGISKMKTEVLEENLIYKYSLVHLNTIPSKKFLSSSKPEEVILAVLGEFGDVRPEDLLKALLSKLNELTTSKLRMNKHIVQLEVLSNLRNLHSLTTQIVEKMPITYDLTKDVRYLQGFEVGDQKAKILFAKKLLKSEAFLNGTLSLEEIVALTDLDEKTLLDIQASNA